MAGGRSKNQARESAKGSSADGRRMGYVGVSQAVVDPVCRSDARFSVGAVERSCGADACVEETREMMVSECLEATFC